MIVTKKPIEFLDFVRKQKCIICYRSPCDPDHLNSIGMGRDRSRPDLLEHLSCIPLCRSHHIERHAMSLSQFENKFKVNVWEENHHYLTKWLNG